MAHTVDPHAVLMALVQRCGTQAAAARELGLSQNYLSDLVHQRRTFSPRVLAALGLQQTIIVARQPK